MKYATLLFFTLLFLSLSFVSGEVVSISTINYNWYLTGELTNVNPYSVFITIPNTGTEEVTQLNSPESFLKVTVGSSNDTIISWHEYETKLNGKEGFWIPPYSTLKIRVFGQPKLLDLTVDNTQPEYELSGPGLVSQYININPYKLFPIYKKGVLLNNFKLYVYGSIEKTDDTDVLSIVVPAPLILNNYYRFNKIISSNEVDIWDGSYKDYLERQNKLTYKMNPELYNIDNSLTPIEDGSLGINYNLKPFDVPIMAFTTSDTKPVNFAYTMYWDSK